MLLFIFSPPFLAIKNKICKVIIIIIIRYFILYTEVNIVQKNILCKYILIAIFFKKSRENDNRSFIYTSSCI